MAGVYTMLKIQLGGKARNFERNALNPDFYTLDGNSFRPDIRKISDTRYHLIHGGRSFLLELVKREGNVFDITVNGKHVSAAAKSKLDQMLDTLGIAAGAGSKLNDLKAPMPGLILEIPVSVGTTVKKGDPLLVLEAMKMENVIKASGDGVVKEVKVKKGEKVEKGQIMLRF
ncbi:MAG: biotin/lipoyl-containing protein [Bacteroidota bacterium]